MTFDDARLDSETLELTPAGLQRTRQVRSLP